MPTASIDFTLSASAMILLVMGAIFGVNMIAEPYLQGDTLDEGRYSQIARNLLLSEGQPADWGTTGNPTYLGLASDGGPYELDIDKVTRLNPSNEYAVNYSDLWQALGVDDVSFNIEVDALFNFTIRLTGSEDQGSGTTYTFDTLTTRDGYPIQSDVKYHLVINNSTYTASGSTDAIGEDSAEFTLPNSLSGTVVLIGIAKAEESKANDPA